MTGSEISFPGPVFADCGLGMRRRPRQWNYCAKMQNRVLLCMCTFVAYFSLAAANLYAYTAVDIHGNEVPLEKYEGKVIERDLDTVHEDNHCYYTVHVSPPPSSYFLSTSLVNVAIQISTIEN